MSLSQDSTPERITHVIVELLKQKHNQRSLKSALLKLSYRAQPILMRVQLTLP